MKEGLVQESCDGLDVPDWSLHRKPLRMQHVGHIVFVLFNAKLCFKCGGIRFLGLNLQISHL